MKIKNIALQRYGKLVAVMVSHRINNHTYWQTLCDCGEIKNIRLDKLTTGLATSCGCDSKRICKPLLPKTNKLGILERIRYAILRYTGF